MRSWCAIQPSRNSISISGKHLPERAIRHRPIYTISDATPRVPPRSKGTTLWFTPMHDPLDLEQAGQLIANAQEGILFLMLNPGPRGTLLNDIIELASPSSPKFNPSLYIQGVVNQNPGTEKNPVILFNRSEQIDANADGATR